MSPPTLLSKQNLRYRPRENDDIARCYPLSKVTTRVFCVFLFLPNDAPFSGEHWHASRVGQTTETVQEGGWKTHVKFALPLIVVELSCRALLSLLPRHRAEHLKHRFPHRARERHACCRAWVVWFLVVGRGFWHAWLPESGRPTSFQTLTFLHNKLKNFTFNLSQMASPDRPRCS